MASDAQEVDAAKCSKGASGGRVLVDGCYPCYFGGASPEG
jgi:hypothetical protein